MIVVTSKWVLLSKLTQKCQNRILLNLNLVPEVGGSTFINLIHRDEPCKLLLAFDGKVIVGWCAWFYHNPLWVYRRQFYVHPDYRRKGIATMLAKQSVRLTGDDIDGEAWNQSSRLFFDSLREAA